MYCNCSPFILTALPLPILYTNYIFYISPTAKIDCTLEQLRNTLKSMMCLPHNQEYKEKAAQNKSRRKKENLHHAAKRKVLY
jgi:hypothetical protein